MWEVLDGVEDGDTIVVSAQFLIDSESNLTAAIRNLDSGADMPTAPAMPAEHEHGAGHSATPPGTQGAPLEHVQGTEQTSPPDDGAADAPAAPGAHRHGAEPSAAVPRADRPATPAGRRH